MYRKGLTVTTILIAAIIVVLLSLAGFYIYSTIDTTAISDDNPLNNTPGTTGTPVTPIDITPQTHLTCISNRCVVVQGTGPNLNGCTTINSACTAGTGGGGSGGGGSGGGGSGGGNGGGGTSNVPPIAQFEAIPSNGPAPLNVSLNASTSYDSDGTIVSYVWNFGDTLNGSGILLTHYFANPGKYNITLMVTDDDGAMSNSTSTITVGNPLDTTPPQYSGVFANPSTPTYAPGQTYTFSSTWTDVQGIDHVDFILDGVTYSTNRAADTYFAQLTNLRAGAYFYSFKGYDISNNTNQTSNIAYVVSKNVSVLGITVTPSNTVQQNTQTTALGNNCPSQITCTLTRNGVSVSNPDVQTLSIGTYTYNYSTSGNVNYSASSTTSTVTVTSLPTFILTVTNQQVNGGSGTVTSNPSGINCGADCTEPYSQGTLVSLSAVPSTGSLFTGWSGACSGIGACQVTMSQAQSVTATFSLAAPTAPSNLQATAISQTRIDLIWVDNSNNEAGFILERATNNAFTANLQTFPLSANTQSFSDTTLVAGTTYFYRVRATNAAGSSSNSNTASATTLLAVPTAPGGVSALTQSSSSILVSWSASPSSTIYTIYHATSPGGTFTQIVGTSAGTTFSHTPLTPGTTHYYQITANNSGGESAHSSSASNITITSAPTGLAVTATTISSISLSWTATTGASSYLIYRSFTSGGTYSLVGSSATASFNDLGLASNTQYFYKVSGVNAGGESVQSAFVGGTTQLNTFTLTVTNQQVNGGSGTVTSNTGGINCGTTCQAGYSQGTIVTLTATPAAGTTFTGWSGACTGTGSCQVTMNSNQAVTATFSLAAPTAPSNLQATAISQTRIDLTWTDNSNNEANFILERSTSSTFTSIQQTFTPIANAQSFSDSVGLVAGTTYFYRVRATNAAGSSSNSNTGSATTISNPPVAPIGLQALTQSTSAITISWSAAVGATSYTVYHNTAPTGTFTSIGTSVTTTLPHTGLTAGSSHYYQVSASNAGGESTHTITVNNITITAPPSGLTVSGTTPNSISLSWSATTGASSYTVYRSLTSGGTYTSVGTTSAVIFTDASGLNPGTTYFYKVSASNMGGESIQSAFTSGTTQTNSFVLTVTKSGTGSGTVTSNPAGINCGATCSTSFTSGTPVVLSATPIAGSTFAGWSGAGCTGTGSCTVTMSQAQSVTATFTLSPSQFNLTVTKAGTGAGTVTSNPAGINCGATCLASYTQGTAVVLTASPTTGSTFMGWAGACTGTGSCQVTMNSNQAVTATFSLAAPQQFNLAVTKSGTGSGTVASNPAGISCGATCNANYNSGTPVILTATPAVGTASPMLQVQGKNILDRCGAVMTLRGFEQQQNPIGTNIGAPPINGNWNYIVDDLVARGANDIRILPSVTLAETESLINYSAQRGLVVHTHANYQWYLDANVKTMLDRYKSSMVLDIFGEPGYNNRPQWQTETMQALTAVRNFGYDQPLMIMANNYGRDLPVVLSYGQTLEDADPFHKVIFGWQAYWGQSNWYQGQYGMTLAQAFASVNAANFPIIAGLTADADSPSDPIDYRQEMALANQYSINTFWWDYYNVLTADINDVVTLSGNQLQLLPLGQTIFVTDPNSLANHPVVRACTGAASSSTFAGWSGACSGTGTCSVTMNSNQTVTATFNSVTSDTLPPSVTLSNPGNGATVTSSPQTFSAQISDNVQLKNATFTLWNGNTVITQSFQTVSGTSATATFSNIVLPSQTTYKWNARVCDTSHNCAWGTSNFTFTYTTSSSAPTIAFTSPTPANGATQTSTSVTIATTSTATSQYYTMLDFNRDLALWMRMDDIDGSGNPRDLSTYSNNGTRNGNAVQSATGKFGESFSFDGNGDFINVANPNGLDFGGSSFTISLWVNPTTGSTTPWPTLLEYNRFGTNWFGMWKTDTNHFHFRVGAVGTDFVSTVANGQWYHVVGVFDAATNTVTLYQNGVQDRSLVVAPGTLAPVQSALRIASSADATGEYYSGGIDEIMIFRRALTANEVSSLFSATSSQSRAFTGLPFNFYQYQSHAVDAQGQRGDTEVRDLTIQLAPDATPPTATLTSPASGSTVSSSPQTFIATVTDNQALKNATFTLWNGNTVVTQSTQTVAGTTATATFAGIALPSTGTYKWNVRVCDLSHNCASGTNNFTVTFTPPICGNGIIESGEQCEGSNLNGQTCQSQGFSGGTLSCSASCQFNTQQCTGSSGWTILTPRSSSQIIYISTSGSDSADCVYTPAEIGGDVFNPAIPITPCQSLANGYSRLRSGQDDYLLLKRGDVWTFTTRALTLDKNGASAANKMVIGSWAPASTPNNQRPKLQVASAASVTGDFDFFRSEGVSNLAITDLYLYVNTPDNVPINGLNGRAQGIAILTGTAPATNLLFENLRIERFHFGVAIYPTANIGSNIVIRRNIFADQFNILPGAGVPYCGGPRQYDTSGFLAMGQNYLVEENILAHNGMSGTLTGLGVGTCHNHNAYFSFNTGDMQNLTARNNFFVRGLDGAKFGSINGGDIINNTFIRNAISLLECCEVGQRVMDNVFIDSRYYAPQHVLGWGVDAIQNSNIFSGNIMAHQRTSPSNTRAVRVIGGSNTQIDNNIIYNWCASDGNFNPAIIFEGTTPSTLRITNNEFQQNCPAGYTGKVYQAGIGATYSGNTYWSGSQFSSIGTFAQWLAQSHETGATLAQIPYIDPNRDASTYMNMLFGTNYAFGSEEGLKAFDDRLRNQSKWDYDARFTTTAFNKYVRDGFLTGADGPLGSPAQTGSGSRGDAPILNTPNGDTSPLSSLTSLLRRIFGFNVATSPAGIIADDQNVGIVGHAIASSNVRISDQKLLLSVIALLVIAIALVIVTVRKHSKK